MDEPEQSTDQPLNQASPDAAGLPKTFPLVRYYLLASILLVVGAFAIINFSTQRFQSGTAINSIRQQAEAHIESVVFDISLAITSYVHPGDDLAAALGTSKREFDRDVINALSGEPILRVDILTPAGELAYSTDPNAAVAITENEAGRVIAGQPYSAYHDKFALTLFNGTPMTAATVVTANPVNTEWSVENTGPIAVMVAFRDVTNTVPTVTGLAPDRIAVLGGTMAGLFVLLSWIVIRGHRFTTEAKERLTEMLGTERDMRSQLDIRNAELEEANRAKSQFLSMVSHELKTPLTSIITFSRLLDKSLRKSLNERQEKQFEALSRNSMLLKLLIDELLDVSAASTGKLRLSFEQVTAAEIVSEAYQTVQPMVDGRRQTLSVQFDKPDIPFTGDPARLQQVIGNLLSNASKYSPEGSEIKLDVLARDGKVCFRVEDNGIGISEVDQTQLFSTFFRSKEAIASGVPGTGLGLVIVRSIVEGHSGTVKVESAVGSGTTVSIEIPLDLSIPEAVVPADGEAEVAA